MPRFEDFDKHEHSVIKEALEWAQSEFYDPGHTTEDRDTLHALIEEITHTEPSEPSADCGPFVWEPTPRLVKGEIKIAGPDGKEIDLKDVKGIEAEGLGGIFDVTAPETVGGYDRGGHPILRRPDGSTERITTERPPRQEKGRPQRQPGEYTGFLYIECAHCGHIHAFCAKQPIRSYRCEECGERTPLIDMYPLRVACECGARFNYLTNIVTQQMDVTCYRCGAPVAVAWVDKLQKYQPMTFPGGKHRSNKGKKGGRRG